MRTALVIAVLLAASPAQGASLTCALWPKSCQPLAAIPAPTVPVEVAPLPPVVVAPVPPPARAAAPAHPVPHVQTGRLPKSKWKPVKRKAAVLPDWCARVPRGTTMWQVEMAAPLWGVTLTDKNRQQARACLASK